MSVAPEDLALLLPEDAGAIRDSLVALLNLDNTNLLAELATAARCGTIEIQGDHSERVAERLRPLGYAVNLAGG